MKDWLIRNKDLLSIRGIEKAIGCPASTLSKAIKGRNLPKKWEEPLRKVAIEMSYSAKGMTIEYMFGGPKEKISDLKDIGPLVDVEIELPAVLDNKEQIFKKSISTDELEKMVKENNEKIKSKKQTRRF